MEEKGVAESRVILSQVMLPQDANTAGNVHGGVVMKHIFTAAGVVAARHSRSNAVTVSIGGLDFDNPLFADNLLILKASVNMVRRTSMEIGVRAEAEDIPTGRLTHITSAYLTFVALDEKGTPREVPHLALKSEDEKRREMEARFRRRTRLAERPKKKNASSI